MRKATRNPSRRTLATLIAACAVGLLALPASALGAPQLQVSSTHYPEEVPVGTGVQYTLAVSNAGDEVTNTPIEVELSVPTGLEILTVDQEGVPSLFGFPIDVWSCLMAPDNQSVSCTGPPGELAGLGLEPGPGEEACVGFLFGFGDTCHITVDVVTDSDLPLGSISPTVEACGGGDPTCFSGGDPTEIVGPPEFDVKSFDGGVFDQDGKTVTQAGSHPHTGSTSLRLDTILAPLFGKLEEISNEEWKDTFVKLPPGLIGNPEAVGTCTQAQLAAQDCPPESQVGMVDVVGGTILGGSPGSLISETLPVFRIQAPPGIPAIFAFKFLNNLIYQRASLRKGDDYGINVETLNNVQTLPLVGVDFTFWGVPADPSHDSEREVPLPPDTPIKAFLSLPTSCNGPVDTDLTVTSWPGNSDNASFTSHDDLGNPVGNTGCDQLEFEPTLVARPTTNVADSPTGLEVDLKIPQDQIEDPEELVTAHLKKAEVTLPEGMTINAAGANGLGACSPEQVGLLSAPGVAPAKYTPDPADCPAASRIASVVAHTPLLDHPVTGSAYVAKPYENPFGSLLAIYLALNDPESGTVVKLAGEIHPDPGTGRLTTIFDNNPQLPVSEIKLDFFGGANAPLKTPPTCGSFSTTSQLTPWSAPDSGPPADPSDTYLINQGPGGACAEQEASLPHAPSFDAGAVEPLAGRYSPFVVNLRRNDGSQRFSSVKLTPPPGLTAKLAGTPYCPEDALAAAAAKSGRAEEQTPSCPAATKIGDVFAAAGAGPAPYNAPGSAYLTGPYKGAPLSLAVIAPATAGPFDLGTVVVRTALYVDPATAQITAQSDPLPRILEGVPLDIRSVSIRMNKPQFTKNPTSCDPTQVGGEVLSTLSQVAPLSARFQLAECTRLGFRPKLTLSLKGATTRGKHPALTAVLTPREGDANIAALSVALPKSEFLDQAHIGTVCTRVQFAADQCPAASIYGEATVTTPILDYPLTGHVYLRSSNNLLPDLVPDLRGPAYQPIRVESAGRTDSIKGGLRNTFDFVPDAPFTKLVVKLRGGKKGLLQNSRNICAQTFRATVKYTAHNGAARTAHPKLGAQCAKARKGKGARKGHGAR